MKNLFLDTNILLDYLAQREPFFGDAEKIFSMAASGEVSLCCSSLSFSTIFYVLRKLQSPTELVQTLTDLTQAIAITGVDEKTIQDALASGFKDLEDAIQYFSAMQFGGVDAIVTRNPKDFIDPKLTVFSPTQFLASLKK